MIPGLEGWTTHAVHEALVLVPSSAPRAGGIRYRERVRPLLRLDKLIDLHLRARPKLVDVELGAVEVLATAGGEYGAMVTARGTEGGRPVQQDLAFLFGDDYYALLHGICGRPRLFGLFTETVRRLVLGDQHFLGQRRRRFLYDPPAAWHGLARGFQTDWYPLDFPANLTSISVFPALPGSVPPRLVVDRRIALDRAGGLELESRSDPVEAASDHGLEGETTTITGRKAGREVVRMMTVLQDGRYSYALVLESAGTPAQRRESVAIYEALLRSCRPIPHRQRGAQEMAAALEHWA